MYRWEKAAASSAAVARGNRYERELKNPSFSSTLLDEIYRSIDEGDNKLEDLRFYGETMLKKQSKGSRAVEEEQEVPPLPRARLIEQWMDKKVSQSAVTTQQQRRPDLAEFRRDCHYHHDQDALFFSTTSRSSDSSSGGFSSSDVDSIYGGRSKPSSFAPPRPRPVRTRVAAPPEKTERTRTTLLYEHRELRKFDDYHYNSATDHISPRLEETLIKSKSRALKIYNNLKKMRQPISPGGKFASFINSLFSTGSTKKSKNSSSSATRNCHGERKFMAGKESTCSSASSFSRSCLIKNSPSTRERLRNGVKRTVRFVDEPRVHKSLNGRKEEDQRSLMSVSLPTAWKIGKSPSRKLDDELKHQLMEKGRRVEEMARDFLKDYHQIQKQNDLAMRDVCRNRNRHYQDDYDYDDDDALSYSSSDLFELDHLAVIGNDRYRQELPVYETTHVDTNRAIANGLMIM